MLRTLLSLALAFLALSSPARALEECNFTFDLDTQSPALQSLTQEAAFRGGFWRPIAEAPDDVREVARFVGRLDICLRTPDGLPRTIKDRTGTAREIKSPFISKCTATLLPGNQLLTNAHCYYDQALQALGFTIVDQVRINFGYTEQDVTADVITLPVANTEAAIARHLDAMILQIYGDANSAVGGHFPLDMATRVNPRQALTMIHHPRGAPLQFSSGTCQVHPAQARVSDDMSLLRHSCESTGGSSGALLLDARSLAVVGLHNTGGLGTDRGFNGGHKIAMIDHALKTGFKIKAAPPQQIVRETLGKPGDRLTAAMLIDDDSSRRVALLSLQSDFPGSDAAKSAAVVLSMMSGTNNDSGTSNTSGNSKRSAKTGPPQDDDPGTGPLTVRSDGSGHYSTIAEAIAAAAPHARIEVYPGLYTGAVTIDKPLELVGAGDRYSIVWEVQDASVIIWSAPNGRISNLTIRQTGGPHAAIRFSDGSATIDGNDISGRDNSVIRIAGRSAPIIRNNLIHGGSGAGITVYDRGEGLIEGNQIHNNENGIFTNGFGNPLVRGNMIKNNRRMGIWIGNDGRGKFVENTLSDNGDSAFFVSKNAGPFAREGNTEH